MDGIMKYLQAVFLLSLGLLSGCQPPGSTERLPDVRSTLDAIGRRLCSAYSEATLTEMASRTSGVLRVLTARERDVLARAYLRFRTPVPVVVEVAAPERSVPFWIEDLGFAPTSITLHNEDATWKVFRREYPAGWVGLGVNGLDRTSKAHYAVFVRPRAGAPPLRPESITFEPHAAERWASVVARQRVSAERDVAHAFDELPDELTGALLLQADHDHRHSTLLASGRVWKTHVPSGIAADQVTISFGSNPGRELIWSWRTAPQVDRTVLRLIPAGFQSAENDRHEDPELTGVRMIPGSSSIIRSPNLLNDPIIRRHVVTVGDLRPDTTYLYSIGDGSSTGWGPWRTTRTGGKRPGRTEFLYMGDAQTGLEDWGKRLETAFRRHPGIDFILLAGDLVDRGNERTNWDHFFLRSKLIFERIPVMPCVGNHEYLDLGPRLYRSFFELPHNGPEGVAPDLVYCFETGSAFFAVLDSTLAISSPQEARRQAEWLDEVLSRTQARWKFVMFHHPVYPSHPWRDESALREYWVPIFDKHRVDLVLQGHDHAYLRTYPMRENRTVTSVGSGTIYVVSVAGDKFCDQRTADYIQVGLTHISTYQTIEISDVENRLTYRAWKDDGTTVDQLVLDKSQWEPERDLAQRPTATIR
jgi:hypothetical protein